jgi:hypothetical protein
MNVIVVRVDYMALRVVRARYACYSLVLLLAKWMVDGTGDVASEMREYREWVEDQAFPNLLKAAR